MIIYLLMFLVICSPIIFFAIVFCIFLYDLVKNGNEVIKYTRMIP